MSKISQTKHKKQYDATITNKEPCSLRNFNMPKNDEVMIVDTQK